MRLPPYLSLARAQLRIMEPPSSVGARPGRLIASVPFQFNPNKLTVSKSVHWSRQPSRMASESSLPEFVGSGPRSLTVDVFLDATANHDNTIERRVRQLMSACVPTPRSLAARQPASPWVRFEWGTARTTAFDAVVTNLSVDYSLFDVDGKPLRATCSITLEEASTGPAGQNPTSGSLEARRTHQVVAGDSLPQLAWQEYGDATAWRIIAEANDIDDPMTLTPGTELLVPADEDVA
ncbi:LysM peptidoglycan-binding domain-containing protein [Actinocrispum wychmicini]|uniref:LysM domain-containing protein n=1 Tax=Actinocrispum wychmicini TaxID=1213861 RepID=A0A4R2JCL8_9PSEU|nr:LysM peptidoglycan-binding domain-containing protein [Actinocrispum wychmicini]TCO55772.1 LysM domain-containing protein [Actinocrispum wychmicini]